MLLDNGLVTEALNYERCHRALGGGELSGWLLSVFQQHRLLKQLMPKTLNSALECRCVEFLRENVGRECAKLLYVFYMQHDRYQEVCSAAWPPPRQSAQSESTSVSRCISCWRC